jgi:hypothetical protein
MYTKLLTIFVAWALIKMKAADLWQRVTTGVPRE